MIEADSHRSTEALPAACWRCRLPVTTDDERCPHCRAPQRSATEPVPRPETSRLARILFAYCILLVLNAVLGIARHQVADADQEFPTLTVYFLQTAVLEVIDSLSIIAFYLWTMGGVRRPVTDFFRTLLAIGWGLIGLFLLLVINFSYHLWLQWLIGADPELLALDGHWTTWLAVVVLICAQPAIFEEIFFRRMVVDSLCEVVSWQAAVWIAAVMFAVAHLGAPLSIPYLILLGAFLGYVRVGSGSLWLPITLHFLHNLLVCILEQGV